MITPNMTLIEIVKAMARASRLCPVYPRRGEIAALHWEDVDFVNGTITIRRSYSFHHYKQTGCYFKDTKIGQERTVDLTKTAANALHMIWERQCKPSTGLILQSPSGKPIYGQMREDIFLYPMRKAGLVTFENGRRNGRGKYTFHDMRHYGESKAVHRAGFEHLPEIAATAGHSVQTALKRYYHPPRDGTVQRATAEIAAEHAPLLLPAPDGNKTATGDYQAARYLAKNNRFATKR
jgi:integrase